MQLSNILNYSIILIYDNTALFCYMCLYASLLKISPLHTVKVSNYSTIIVMPGFDASISFF